MELAGIAKPLGGQMPTLPIDQALMIVSVRVVTIVRLVVTKPIQGLLLTEMR
jgi:hypothetical protein